MILYMLCSLLCTMALESIAGLSDYIQRTGDIYQAMQGNEALTEANCLNKYWTNKGKTRLQEEKDKALRRILEECEIFNKAYWPENRLRLAAATAIGASLNVGACRNNNTALLVATTHNDLPLITFLFAHKMRKITKQSALFHVKSVAALEIFIKNGISVLTVEPLTKKTILHAFIVSDCKEWQALINFAKLYGAYPSADNNGDNPLHQLASKIPDYIDAYPIERCDALLKGLSPIQILNICLSANEEGKRPRDLVASCYCDVSEKQIERYRIFYDYLGRLCFNEFEKIKRTINNCSICFHKFDEKPDSHAIVLASCGHCMCWCCLHDYYYSNQNHANKCPVSGCPVPLQILFDIVPDDLIAKDAPSLPLVYDFVFVKS